jgi:hypothetical protein
LQGRCYAFSDAPASPLVGARQRYAGTLFASRRHINAGAVIHRNHIRLRNSWNVMVAYDKLFATDR